MKVNLISSPNIPATVFFAGEISCFGAARGFSILSHYYGNMGHVVSELDLSSGVLGCIASLFAFIIAYKEFQTANQIDDEEGKREAKIQMIRASISGIASILWMLHSLMPETVPITILCTLLFGIVASMGAAIALHRRHEIREYQDNKPIPKTSAETAQLTRRIGEKTAKAVTENSLITQEMIDEGKKWEETKATLSALVLLATIPCLIASSMYSLNYLGIAPTMLLLPLLIYTLSNPLLEKKRV